MEQIVFKSELESNGEIFLFYVDEEGNPAQGVVTATQDFQTISRNDEVQLSNEDTYVLDIKTNNVENESDVVVAHEERLDLVSQNWTDEDNHRLLSFYVDNKQTFKSGVVSQHLWAVVCNTLLRTKSPDSCEMQFQQLKNKYAQLRVENRSTDKRSLFQLCHKAFFDDEGINEMVKRAAFSLTKVAVQEPVNANKNVTIIKNCANKTPKPITSIESLEVIKMLNLYLKYKNAYKNEHFTKGLWDLIAAEMGQEDSEYLQRRFYNYKNHYIRMLDRRVTDGPNSVMWPYMSHFDQIYKNDEDFQRRYGNNKEKHRVEVSKMPSQSSQLEASVDWTEPEKVVLVKYYFDSFHEFMDSTIPDNFLWTEVGRLLDRKPEACKAELSELKREHLQKYIEGNYEILKRTTLAILNDNVICKEVKWELSKPMVEYMELWETEEIDGLVQFFYDSIEMFKDRVCYFVCWSAVSVKLKRDIQNCRRQWQSLLTLYKSILEDKKENPDMQIDWRYIDLFDRIFDYGMDTNLLEGYQFEHNTTPNVLAKSVRVTNESGGVIEISDEEEYDERGFSKRSKHYTGDSKAFKILEFYQKHKEKFHSTRRKQALWEQLSKQIGISPAECAHRFRNFKQVYTSYIQREINKPEMPILWPYYALCKKVFGYRALKAKLKNEHRDSDDSNDWTAKEIKALINYLGKHLDNINLEDDTRRKWVGLSSEIGKNEFACNDKFLELRKSYRKLKTLKTKNPYFKVSWKYYKMLDEIYSKQSDLKQNSVEYMDTSNNAQVNGLPELPEDDDYQCIIIMPEGEELTDFSTAQFNAADLKEPTIEEEVKSKTVTYWTFKAKRQLLLLYMKYLKAHKKEPIISADMWREIALGLQNKSAFSARKMFAKLKSRHSRQNIEDCTKETEKLSPLWKRILSTKRKFAKTMKNDGETMGRVYKNVVLPDSKVQDALQYYMEHLDEFLNPEFDKKFLWTELAKCVDLPFLKIYHKIHYLKNNYDSEAKTTSAGQTPFDDILRQILAKEKSLKDSKKFAKEADAKCMNDDSPWSDDEIEQLLMWYLAKLDQFKNPKYVRSYLWKDASKALEKSAISCSKKMSEIRTQYRTMVKENLEELNNWRFHSLCQKIYGTGKKNSPISAN